MTLERLHRPILRCDQELRPLRGRQRPLDHASRQPRPVVRRRQMRQHHHPRQRSLMPLRRRDLPEHVRRLLVRQVPEPPRDPPLQRRRIRSHPQKVRVVIRLQHQHVQPRERRRHARVRVPDVHQHTRPRLAVADHERHGIRRVVRHAHRRHLQRADLEGRARHHVARAREIERPRRRRRREHRHARRRQRRHTARVIAVLVRAQDRLHVVEARVQPGRVQPLRQPPRRQARVDQHARAPGFHQDRVARRTGSEDRHPQRTPSVTTASTTRTIRKNEAFTFYASPRALGKPNQLSCGGASMIDDEDQGLHVPKRAVDVELKLAGRDSVRVQVWVPREDPVPAHAVRELLEHASAFLPAREPAAKQTVVFNKEVVEWAALEGEGLEDELYESRHDVRLELIGGGELAGELLYSMPQDHARVADYLNAAGRFVRLWVGERLLLVNKAYIERVIEVPLDLAAAGGGDGD
jgi:hypothetical protein